MKTLQQTLETAKELEYIFSLADHEGHLLTSDDIGSILEMVDAIEEGFISILTPEKACIGQIYVGGGEIYDYSDNATIKDLVND